MDVDARLKLISDMIEKMASSREMQVALSEFLPIAALNAQASLKPYNLEMEAMVLVAYAARNSDVVETTLHSQGEVLTDRLMPEFTGEISVRMWTILKAKEYLLEHDMKAFWQLFVRSYHNSFLF